jgi:hypothetical protein
MPFHGVIKDGFLVNRWPDGNWVSLNLRGAAETMTLQGTHSFVPGGTISMRKLP